MGSQKNVLDLAAFTERAHGQQRDFVFEGNRALHDHLALVYPPALARIFPCWRDIARLLEQGLPFARGRHHGFDEARIADALDCGAQLVKALREAIGEVGSPRVSAASRRMPSRFMVSCVARAAGIT